MFYFSSRISSFLIIIIIINKNKNKKHRFGWKKLSADSSAKLEGVQKNNPFMKLEWLLRALCLLLFHCTQHNNEIQGKKV